MIKVILKDNPIQTHALEFASLTHALEFANDYKAFKPYSQIVIIKQKKVVKTL